VWANEYGGAVNQLNQTFSLNRQELERAQARIKLADDLKAKADPDYKKLEEDAGKAAEQASKDAADAASAHDTALKAVVTAGKDDKDKAQAKADEAAVADTKAKAAAGVARQRIQVIREYANLQAKLDATNAAALKANPAAVKVEIDWDDETKKGQDDQAKAQKEMGDAEKKMNPLKTVWLDLLADGMRCRTGAIAQFYKAKPDELATQTASHAKNIFNFEKSNRPLPNSAKQKLADLLDANETLKKEYEKLGGVGLLAPAP
jgi:hypothetical protein